MSDMAFDMYAGEYHEKIEANEEYLFEMVSSDRHSFPVINDLRSKFYDDPKISVLQSELLIYELISLLAQCMDSRDTNSANIIARLLLFFSQAKRQDIEIQCKSD
jgi:hypothetical protein